ncbi:hypothetical protein QQF64_006725 [Cirrhinus molitorella]|uniref:Uncharacterized protein n=1 Tax=Cirrhinus molitorella TaxID=172907 RepID=A0ABR3MA33_9TELE
MQELCLSPSLTRGAARTAAASLRSATRSPAEGGVRARWRRSLILKRPAQHFEPEQLHLCPACITCERTVERLS